MPSPNKRNWLVAKAFNAAATINADPDTPGDRCGAVATDFLISGRTFAVATPIGRGDGRVPLSPLVVRLARCTAAEGLSAGESLLGNDCDRVAETRGRGLACPPDRGDGEFELVDPDDPVVSARADGIDANAEPTPSATANAPTRPTYNA